jgi:tetratricopeptide (TPR) repeat protein
LNTEADSGIRKRKEVVVRIHPWLLVVVLALTCAPIAARAGETPDQNALIAFLKGVYLESENDLSGAYQYYLYASAREPDSPRILLRLSRAAVETGDLEAARRDCEKLIATGEYGVEGRLMLAEVEYRLGEREKARALLTELRSEKDAPTFQILKFLAKIDLDLKKPDEALRYLEQASRLPDADFYVFYELGLLEADAGKKAEALDALAAAVEIDPDVPNAHLARARLFRETASDAEAEREYREVLRLEPRNREATAGLADILSDEGKYAEGADLLAPFYADSSLDDAGEIVYGKFLYKAGRIDSALAVFDRLLAKQGESPPLLRVVSEIEMERGHLKSAYGYLKRLVELEPDRFENYVGLLLIVEGLAPTPSDPGEEVTLTDAERRSYTDAAAARVSADSSGDNLLFGSILRKAGETKRSERYLLRAEELDRGNGDAALELASLYGQEGRFDDALRRVAPLYRADPEDATLENFYGYLLAEKGDSLDLAERLLTKALAKEPTNGYFLDSLGWIKFKQGAYREALDILLEAVDRTAGDAVVWDHIGDVYLKLREPAKALDAYRKSLAVDPRSPSVDDKIRKLEAGGTHMQ